MWKKMSKEILTFFIILLLSTFILTLFNYFNWMSAKMISILKFLITLLTLFITSYRLGKSSEKKGYLEGLKMGSIIVAIFTVCILLLDQFQVRTILYDFILLLTSVLSSMIGINRKKMD